MAAPLLRRSPPFRVGASKRGALIALAAAGLVAGHARRAAAQASDYDTSSESPESLGRAPSSGSGAPRTDDYPSQVARRNLLVAGAVSTGSWYALALASSYLWSDAVGAKDLRIPVAGPWIALSHTGCGNVADCSSFIVVARAIATTIDAIGQASGFAFAAEGLFLPTRERSPVRSASTAASTPRVTLRPTFDAGRNTLGLGVLGVF